MRMTRSALLTVVLALLSGCDRGAPPDEAKAAGKTPLDFQAASHDFFADMDMAADQDGKLKRLDLTIDEIKGRNTWVMWCGGNEAFWDWLSGHSYGFLDLLKLVASPDRAAAIQKRKVRFSETGMINEPGFAPARDRDEFDLFLDRAANDSLTARPKEEVYGRSSGVVGLRLFKNPKFDKAAARRWNAKRYFTDSKYYNDPELVRPYRVGMSCGFCHIAPHPLSPPRDPAEPEWANLSSNIGNQYWRARAVFGGLLKPDNFIYHILDAQPPGTIDTSLIASDNINNPNTMNAIFDVPARLDRSGIDWHRDHTWKAKNKEWHERFKITKGSANLFEEASKATKAMPVLLEYPPYEKKTGGKSRPVPRILLEGADSVGAWSALARVYLNIGTYHQQWTRLHNPVAGFKTQEAFKIDDCEKQSIYWQANKARVEYLAKFFLKSTAPMRLKDAPGGKSYLKDVGLDDKGNPRVADVPWHPELKTGRAVFARRCIVCHSSKQPDVFQEFAEDEKNPKKDRKWEDLLKLLATPAYQEWAQRAVQDEAFWKDNYLSTDHRVPVTLLQTNSARAMATNGLAKHMWEDFTSQDYKDLPAVGAISYFDPFDRENPDKTYAAPGNGRGYYRPATLLSIWATAPYLHNNSVGIFTGDPSVAGRMKAFDDGIRKLLVRASDTKDAMNIDDKDNTRDKLFRRAAENRWKKGSDLNGAQERTQKDHGLIWRTPHETTIRIPAGNLPNSITNITGFEYSWMNRNPWLTPALAMLVALILLLSANNSPWRFFGYAFAAVVLAVVLTAAYIVAKRVLNQFIPLDLDHLKIGYICALAVLLASFAVVFWLCGETMLVRWVGYFSFKLAIPLAIAAYFFAGRLGDLEIGPVPADTPINLLANLGPDPDKELDEEDTRLKPLIQAVIETLHDLKLARWNPDRREYYQHRIAERFMTINRCPDLVMDRGHYFAAELSEQELQDLIDLIKTF